MNRYENLRGNEGEPKGLAIRVSIAGEEVIAPDSTTVIYGPVSMGNRYDYACYDTQHGEIDAWLGTNEEGRKELILLGETLKGREKPGMLATLSDERLDIESGVRRLLIRRDGTSKQTISQGRMLEVNIPSLAKPPSKEYWAKETHTQRSLGETSTTQVWRKQRLR